MRTSHEIIAEFSEIPAGQWFQYWVGNLAADCKSGTPAVRFCARAVQGYFWRKYEDGLVDLMQRRAAPEVSAYLARKR